MAAKKDAGGSSFDCCLIGDNSLMVSCGEALLASGHGILGVVSPNASVREWAEKRSLPWTHPEQDYARFLRERSHDYLFSIVNHRLLSASVLAMPRKLAINFHDSLLPRYAGVHATAWAILNGETEHGVSWHVMSETTDAGDLLKTRKVRISPAETSQSLNLKCYDAALLSFQDLIAELSTGTCSPKPQSATQRTYYARHKKATPGNVIAWNESARSIDAWVRACDFGVHDNAFALPKFLINGRNVSVRQSAVTGYASNAEPGTIVAISESEIRVATADQDLSLLRFAEGGRARTAAQLAQSYGLTAGRRLDSLDGIAASDVEPLLEKVYRREADWVRRFASGARRDAPFRKKVSLDSDTTPAEARSLIVQLPQAPDTLSADECSDYVLAAFGAFLCRTSSSRNFVLGARSESARSHPFASALLAKHVPVEIVIDTQGETGQESLRRIAAALRDARHRPGVLADLPIRYPALSKARERSSEAEWPVVVECVDSLETIDSKALLEGGVELALCVSNGSTRASLHYDSRYLDADPVVRLAEQFTGFLADAWARPAAGLAQLSLLSDESRRRMLFDWNNTVADVPHDKCVHEIIEDQAMLSLNAIAYTFGDEQLTYRALRQKSCTLASHLKAAGLGPGHFVGVFMNRSLDLAVALLAILKSGAAYIPLDPTHPKSRVAMMIDDSQLSALLVDPELKGVLPDCVAPVIIPRHVLAGEQTRSALMPPDSGQQARPSDIAYMIYTSGSTGKPKGVPIKHESLTNLLWSMQRTPGIGVRDKILALTTISFDIACVEMLLPLICGGCVEILPAEITSDGTRMREVLESTDATIVQATPATWRMLLAAGWRARKRFRIWCGGEALAPQLARSLLERCAELWNCYGPTETAIYACFHRVLDPDEIAIGRPVANTQMYVLDEHLNPAPVGIAGELFIGGAGLSPGYHRRPELTQKSFLTHAFDQSGPASRLYRTGDSCRYWRDGSVEYLGRLDNQVKVRGYRIELGEIESVLARHSSVREVVAATRDDEAGNRKIVAYVVPTDAGIPPTAETLRDFLQETLPHYMVPAAFVLLARMPVSPNGKVDRKALHLATPLTRPTPIVATSLSCEEQRVLSIWQEFLSSPDVGLHDNFFDVGGDSILLVQMAQRLSREYGRDFSNMDLFQFPTIASFAGHVAGVAGGRDAGHGMDVPDLQDRAELRAGRLRRKQALKEQT